MKDRLRRGAALEVLGCAVAALVWCGPLVTRAGTHLRDAYDAGLQTWQLAWVRHALATDPGTLFQANALAPSRDVLAFTEPLVGYGVLSVPFAALGPVGAYHAVSLLGLFLAPFALSLLARELGLPRAPSILGALATSYGALTTVHLGYVTFTAWGGIALVLLAWLRLRRTGSRAATAGLALAVAGLGWCSVQLLAFTLAALGAAVLADTVAARRDPSRVRLPRLAAGLALGGLLLLPLAVPLVRVRQREGFQRSDDERRRLQASPRDFLTTTSFNPGQAFLPFRSDSEKALFPGSLALVLAGLSLGWSDPAGRRARRLGGLLVVVGTLGALGTATPFYPLLVLLAPPLYGGIRAAARFAYVAKVGLGLLASAGAARLLEGRGPAVRAGLAATLGALLFVDQRQTAPLAYRPEIPFPPVETFLSGVDPGGPILHLPVSFRPYEARYLLGSLAHFEPIVNATMSYIPKRHLELAASFAEDPIDDAVLAKLEAWPVGTIVVHEHALSPEDRRRTLAFLRRGVEAGRLTSPFVLPHGAGEDFVLGVARVRGPGAWQPPAGAPTASLDPGPAGDGVETPDLPASIDRPEDGSWVRGDLVVSGWAQDETGPAEVVDVRLDGDRRTPAGQRRLPRPDVGAALPRLGDPGRAGYEVVLPFREGDDGVHRLTVRFRSPSGKVRTLDRSFRWGR